MTTSYALVAPLRLGEDAKRYVRKLGVGRSDLKVGRKDNHILIPLARPVEPPFAEARVEVAEFTSSRPPKGYKDVVVVPEKVRPSLPTSFDVVGDLVLIKIPPDIRVFGPAIAEAILKVHKNVKAVFHDEGVQGPFRIRNLVALGGEGRTRTTHAEYGAKFEVDLARAYFSPRLANEHERVASQVGPEELVVDATAGVGGFTVLIGRRRGGKRIHAVDLNPDAVELLRLNVQRNGLESKVDVHEGDAAEVLKGLPEPDRVVVNLPHGGEDIVAAAAARLRSGGRIHYYRVWAEAEQAAALDALLERVAKETGKRLRPVDVHVVHAYSPTDRLYAVDLDAT